VGANLATSRAALTPGGSERFGRSRIHLLWWRKRVASRAPRSSCRSKCATRLDRWQHAASWSCLCDLGESKRIRPGVYPSLIGCSRIPGGPSAVRRHRAINRYARRASEPVNAGKEGLLRVTRNLKVRPPTDRLTSSEVSRRRVSSRSKASGSTRRLAPASWLGMAALVRLFARIVAVAVGTRTRDMKKVEADEPPSRSQYPGRLGKGLLPAATVSDSAPLLRT